MYRLKGELSTTIIAAAVPFRREPIVSLADRFCQGREA